jgi:hypothetical protein
LGANLSSYSAVIALNEFRRRISVLVDDVVVEAHLEETVERTLDIYSVVYSLV